jgi:hypothetical protein
MTKTGLCHDIFHLFFQQVPPPPPPLGETAATPPAPMNFIRGQGALKGDYAKPIQSMLIRPVQRKEFNPRTGPSAELSSY